MTNLKKNIEERNKTIEILVNRNNELINRKQELEKENANLTNHTSILKGKIEMIENAYRESEKENAALKEGNTFNLNLISQLHDCIDELNLQVNQLKRKLKEAGK